MGSGDEKAESYHEVFLFDFFIFSQFFNGPLISDRSLIHQIGPIAQEVRERPEATRKRRAFRAIPLMN
jgi:hypothetical protein